MAKLIIDIPESRDPTKFLRDLRGVISAVEVDEDDTLDFSQQLIEMTPDQLRSVRDAVDAAKVEGSEESQPVDAVDAELTARLARRAAAAQAVAAAQRLMKEQIGEPGFGDALNALYAREAALKEVDWLDNTQPIVGLPATYSIGADSYACKVVSVSRTGHEVLFEHAWGDIVAATRRSGHLYVEKGKKHGSFKIGEAVDYRNSDC